MVSVSDGHCERIGGIRTADLHPRKQTLDHRMNLSLFRTADPDHRFLHQSRRIFADHKSAPGRCEQDDATRMAELEARLRIVVEKDFLNRRGRRPMSLDYLAKRLIEAEKPVGQSLLGVGSHLAVGEMTEAIAFGPDQAPTGAAEARVKADDDQLRRSRTSSETS